MSEPTASVENLSASVTASGDTDPNDFRVTENGEERIFQDDDPKIVNQ